MKFVLLVLMFSLAACSTTGDKERQQSSINKNNVDKVLAKGTTQAKVLEALGSPNTVASDGDGTEVWSYLRKANNSSGSSVGATVWNSSIRYLSWGYLGGDISNSSSTSHETSLIVYFDKSKRVTNHTFRSEIY
jgi:outer membrane protein assembly factor BamE (lipoprotein component of BamABCDE complex)